MVGRIGLRGGMRKARNDSSSQRSGGHVELISGARPRGLGAHGIDSSHVKVCVRIARLQNNR